MSGKMIRGFEAPQSVGAERPLGRGVRSCRILRATAALTLLVGLLAARPVTSQEEGEAGAQRRIINVHEHLQSLAELPKLLAAMDAVGIGKTVLLGSPAFTFTLNPVSGFAGYAANNETVLRAAAEHPERFAAWPTIDPEDPDKLDKLQRYVKEGATGVKLYAGHGYRQPGASAYVFHKMPMDDARLLAVYEYVQQHDLPVMFHVNPGPTHPGFAEEFISVLQRFPDMKVIAPHFILSSIKDTRLREFLDTFPNLYSDISFGRDPYLQAGLVRVSKDAQKFRTLFTDYPDRFMFGTDVTVTQSTLRSEQWLADRFRAYVDMLSKKEYQAVIGRKLGLQGLALPAALRDRILYGNFKAFMAKRASGTRIARQIDWQRMGVVPSARPVAAQAAGPEEADWEALRKEALEAADPAARSKAIQNLARQDDEARILTILVEVLNKDPLPEVRADALSVIEFFDRVPRAPVLDRLASDPAPAIRMHALEIIEDEEWQGVEIEKALIAATDDADAEVGGQAVSLLGDIEAWKALEQIAREHKNEDIRRLAEEALQDR